MPVLNMKKRNYIVLMSLLVSVIMVLVLPFAGAHNKTHLPDPATVPYVSEKPTMDGNITKNEYKDAEFISWSDTGQCGQANDTIHVYIQHDGENLYVAIDVTNDVSKNDTFNGFLDEIGIVFDIDNNDVLDLLYAPPWTDFITISDTVTQMNGGSSAGIFTHGFNKTNHSSTAHTIWEYKTPISALPKPGEIFGVAIWGASEQCQDYEVANNYFYPESAWNETTYMTIEDLNASRMANWTLGEFPPPAPTPIDKLGAFGTYMLIANIAVTSAMITARDPDFIGERMDVASANIGISFIVLILGFVQGWATFT